MQTVLLAVFSALLGSGFMGFIQFLITRHDNKNSKENARLEAIASAVRGLDHDRLYYLSEKYLQRGEITTDEYNNLSEYIYKPYKKLGGNGTGDKLMAQINELPFKK